jgi:hypothetical protein
MHKLCGEKQNLLMTFIPLILASLFAIYWIFRTRQLLPTIISVGMIMGFGVVMAPSGAIKTMGLFVYMGFVSLAFAYAFIAKGKNLRERVIIALMSASILVYWIWALNHWHGNTVILAFITLIVGIMGIIFKAKLRNELGFLVILAADAISIILEKI